MDGWRCGCGGWNDTGQWCGRCGRNVLQGSAFERELRRLEHDLHIRLPRRSEARYRPTHPGEQYLAAAWLRQLLEEE